MFRVLVTCLVRCWLGWVQAEGSRAAASARGAILRCAGRWDTSRATSSATQEGRKEMFYLTAHSTHFIYGYMASDIWLRTILIKRKETCCRHMGYSFRLAARVLLYAPQACYTSRGALDGTKNSSMGPPHEGSIRRPTAP